MSFGFMATTGKVGILIPLSTGKADLWQTAIFCAASATKVLSSIRASEISSGKMRKLLKY